MSSWEEPALAYFVRLYDYCACGGWDERFEGRNLTARGYEPNGEVVLGRSNHRRGCGVS